MTCFRSAGVEVKTSARDIVVRLARGCHVHALELFHNIAFDAVVLSTGKIHTSQRMAVPEDELAQCRKLAIT
jgi:hypothetical protein